MSVYNDMASDAGQPYGTEGNEQLARMAEEEHRRVNEAESARLEYEYECWMEEQALRGPQPTKHFMANRDREEKDAYSRMNAGAEKEK